MDPSHGQVASLMGNRAWLKLGGLVAILVAAAFASRMTPFGDYVTVSGLLEVRETLRSSVWAPVLFVVIYAAATAVALPGSALTIAGGAVFGLWFGALLNTLGANIGASAAFGLARALGREGAKRIGGRRLAGLNRATAERGFIGLLILRLIPLFPFNALNVGSGLTAMRWRDYALATVLGILPGTMVYTFFADAFVEGTAHASRDASLRLWIAAALFLLLIAVPLVARRLGYAPASGRRETP